MEFIPVVKQMGAFSTRARTKPDIPLPVTEFLHALDFLVANMFVQLMLSKNLSIMESMEIVQ